MVGENVEVIVLSLQGEQVRLGIIAPQNVAIHRKEIFEQIQLENKEASGTVKRTDLRGLIKKTE